MKSKPTHAFFTLGEAMAMFIANTTGQTIRRGNLPGSLTVQVRGDSEALPTRTQLNDLEEA